MGTSIYKMSAGVLAAAVPAAGTCIDAEFYAALEALGH